MNPEKIQKLLKLYTWCNRAYDTAWKKYQMGKITLDEVDHLIAFIQSKRLHEQAELEVDENKYQGTHIN